MSKNPKFVAQLLRRLKSVEGFPKWIVVIGDKSGDAGSLVGDLANLDVHAVVAENGLEATSVIMRHDIAPSLIYIFAPEVGGIEQAMDIHRYLARNSGFGKCFIVSGFGDNTLQPYNAAGPADMLILEAGRAATLQ